jgi:hypothetical protein
MEKLTGISTSPTKENSSLVDSGRMASDTDSKRSIGIKTSPSNAMPSRNSPLSWQRRPNSQASDRPRSRPLSMVATENAARSPRATPEPASATEPTFSRDQIAQNLASKDPAWFRQTADRGLNSPAYRKNQVEDEDRSDHGSTSARVQMPGMSPEGSPRPIATEGPPSPSQSSTGSRASYQPSRAPGGGFGSPMPLTPAQKLDPPTMSNPDSRGLAMSPSQGRISPERLDRPSSPTKGMGGFVQSAMMKRSDSVNKRWSVQSPAGLSRGNSVASNRSSADPNSNLALGSIVGATRDAKHTNSSRESSPRPVSRPTSSHSNATITQERPGTASSMVSSITTSTTNDGFIKPPLPNSRTHTPIGVKTGQDESTVNTPSRSETPPPTSPSKTMDSRRWSPTKSSWLESALNKPDSPKPKAVAPPQQPAWMSEINKAKQKASVDLGRGPTPGPKHEVNIGGLMRSPPPGSVTKPTSIGGLPAGFSPTTIPKSRSGSVASQTSKDPPKMADSSENSARSPIGTGVSVNNNKVKPETPPKKDFRASLKSRQPSSDTGGASEPEFKNVFGQLRRTKTQNYVAPDELKDNITRGKAALNLTGGPKKTERKDEFKEAILKKKEDFKKAQSEGRGVTRSASSDSQDTPLPEALAKRRVLGRSDSITAESSSITSDLLSGPRMLTGSPQPTLLKETSAPGRLQAKEPAVSKLAGRLNPGLANLLARGPPSIASDGPRPSAGASSQSTIGTSPATTEATEPGPQLTHMTKSRARGPRRKAPTSTPITTINTSSPGETSTTDLKLSPVFTVKESPLHESKPSSPVKAVVEDLPHQTDAEHEAPLPTSPRKLDLKRRSQFLQEVPNKNTRAEPLGSPKPLSSTKKANSIEVPVKNQDSTTEIATSLSPKIKPNTPIKSPSLMLKNAEKYPISTPTESAGTTQLRPLSSSPTKPETSSQIHPPLVQNEIESAAKSRPLPRTPVKTVGIDDGIMNEGQQEGRASTTANKKDSHETIRTNFDTTSVKTVAALWNRPATTNALETPPRVKSPIRLPTQEDENAALVGAGLRLPSPIRDRAQTSLQVKPSPILTPHGITSPPPSAGLSPNSNASSVLSEFFSDRNSATEFRVDTATILSTRPYQGEDIKTLRSSLYQLSSDGKKQEIPSHQERILFEGNLYLCTHTYGNAAGKKVTEVYFWQGDDVSKSIVDKVEVFVQREAKAAGGKLVTIVQGKETPEFFHALGGIVIIRRGSSNKYDSLAPHILCCRKHFGQIVFDEVDFSPASLCSGFPYLISTQTGKSFLWKGKGSGIEELSCARLIGMDFGLTGEVEEVDDGNESMSFLKIFEEASIPKSADHWRMKPNYSKYCIRLFRAESNTRQQVRVHPQVVQYNVLFTKAFQITELDTFCQADLDWSKIFILDAFFEIYIIVGSAAQAEFASFQHALLFAQEYGILAAGMEDRPFIPVTTVVLEGVPKDLRSVFRKWVPGLSPTLHKLPAAGSLQRGRSLRVLPLNAALEATRT